MVLIKRRCPLMGWSGRAPAPPAISCAGAPNAFDVENGSIASVLGCPLQVRSALNFGHHGAHERSGLGELYRCRAQPQHKGIDENIVRGRASPGNPEIEAAASGGAPAVQPRTTDITRLPRLVRLVRSRWFSPLGRPRLHKHADQKVLNLRRTDPARQQNRTLKSVSSSVRQNQASFLEWR